VEVFFNDNQKTELEDIGKEQVQGLLRMMMLLQVLHICMMLNWIMNPYSANIVIGLAMMSQSVLIFTHVVFVGRPITSQ
jgi:hypothetical protein